MNSIWSNLYDSFKDRRYAFLFFATFFASLILIVLVAGVCGMIDDSNIQAYFLQVLPGVGILIIALVWRAIRKTRARRRNKFQRQEMSRDEIRKARSKLVNKSKR
ncbi:MAG TPA: hypothetical protein VGH42_10425 [Verrucomicrobiae bacterium]|jgi:hypothetical protein